MVKCRRKGGIERLRASRERVEQLYFVFIVPSFVSPQQVFVFLFTSSSSSLQGGGGCRSGWVFSTVTACSGKGGKGGKPDGKGRRGWRVSLPGCRSVKCYA
jgi:hypothetical protein